MTRPDTTALCVCLIFGLLWSIVGVLLEVSFADLAKGFAFFVASFYFGRWCKRNFG